MESNWQNEAAAEGAPQNTPQTTQKGTDASEAALLASLYGEWNNALDDKGRLSFPVKLRSALSADKVVLVKGISRCVWVFPPAVWEEKAASITALPSTAAGARAMKRHFLGSAVESEVDKSGRLPVPQTLREYAHLARDCKIVGLGDKAEIWDAASYDSEDISAIAAQFNVF